MRAGCDDDVFVVPDEFGVNRAQPVGKDEEFVCSRGPGAPGARRADMTIMPSNSGSFSGLLPSTK